MRKITSRIAMAMVLLVGLAELTLRVIGMVDFPLYHADARIGYVPMASQEGSFLRRNTWAFNEMSMGTARRFDPSAAANDVFLVGDSIVLGGNTLPQGSKLASLMEAQQERRVWPIAAGSWALRNELRYIKDHPDVARKVGRLVLVLNSADFGEASSWACELTHPRQRPALALLYVARKYVHDWAPCGSPPQELQVPPGDWRAELRHLVDEGVVRPADTTVVLYPTRKEAGEPTLMAWALESRMVELKAVMGDTVRFISVGRDHRWTTDLYRDDIHPSAQGYAVLAKVIGAGL
ncbi:MAG: SGNH/GDSL hydrolase family protein [Burkholderiales bacterium]|nr:SGNH/GDSL hydrolase family protein [Burkholderiales bacterium]MBH2015027.1 SGNH/GDSL hydrolase family protein [Burkholderiales bacterium]